MIPIPPEYRHYDGHITIVAEDIIEIETEYEDPMDVHYGEKYKGIPSGVVDYTIRTHNYTVTFQPGKNLTALMDLGFTEDQGNKMLDAIKEA